MCALQAPKVTITAQSSSAKYFWYSSSSAGPHPFITNAQKIRWRVASIPHCKYSIELSINRSNKKIITFKILNAPKDLISSKFSFLWLALSTANKAVTATMRCPPFSRDWQKVEVFTLRREERSRVYVLVTTTVWSNLRSNCLFMVPFPAIFTAISFSTRTIIDVSSIFPSPNLESALLCYFFGYIWPGSHVHSKLNLDQFVWCLISDCP